jgi:uncharacterized protein (TIGR02001 family)
MNNPTWPGCAAALGLLLAGPAQATFSSNFTLASQYVSRGVQQSWGRPALQGGLDWTTASGWFAGTWSSSVDRRFADKAHTEIDFYGGYAHALQGGSLSAALYYYRYPGAAALNYGELSLAANWGVLYGKVNLSYTPDFFGIPDARGTSYVDLGANPGIGDGWTLNLHAGSGRVAGRGNGLWDWRDVKLGLAKDLGGGWSTALAWTRAWNSSGVYAHYVSASAGADGRPLTSNTSAGTLVLSVTRTF